MEAMTTGEEIIAEVIADSIGAHYRTPNDKPTGTKLLFQSVIMQAVADLADEDDRLFTEAAKWIFCDEEDTGRGTMKWYAEQIGIDADKLGQRIWSQLSPEQKARIKRCLLEWKDKLPGRYSVD